MDVEAADLPYPFGVVIRIFRWTVLAEADNPPVGSGSQHPATEGSLRANNLAPIADGVCGESLAVPRLVRAIPIRELPGNEVQVP
jgi:hypothetical protein